MSDIERLEGLLREIAGSVNEVKEETEKVKEEMAKKLEEHEKAIEHLMSQPKKEAIPVPGNPGKTVEVFTKEVPAWMLPTGEYGEKYKGYHLPLQGRSLHFIKDEDYRQRFAKFMIDVFTRTALGEGTAAQGGYLVPDEFEPTILAFAREKSTIALQRCWVIPMSTDTKKVPTEASGATVAWKGEATAAGESSGPTVGEASLSAKRLTAYKEASNELIEDAAIDVVSWLTELFAEAIGLELDNQVLNGTGDPVSGVLTAKAGYSVVMATGSTNFSEITGTHLSEMMSKLKESVLAGAVFVMHRTVFHYVRTAKDNQNAFIYSPMSGPVPEAVWGLPYILHEKAPSSSGADTAFVSLGNFRYFIIGRRKGDMKLFVNPYSLDKENQTRFKVETRWGLEVGQANAFVRLLTAAS